MDDEEDAKTKLIWQDFFRKLDFTVKKSNNYADILIDKGIGKIDLLVKRCARKPTYLVDIGFDEDDVDEIMEALQKLNAPSLDRRESSGANGGGGQQPPPLAANEPLPPATPMGLRAESSHDLVREASVQHLFLEIRSFTVKGVLGEGGMARAYHCIYAGTHVAVKEVSNEKNRAQFLHEIQVHSKFNHPYVVGVMGVVKARVEELKQLAVSSLSKAAAATHQYRLVEDPDRRLLVVHYCSQGSLRDFLKLIRTGRYGFDEATCLRIVHEVAAGMAFLHAHNIVHLDLKPANIFLKDGWTAQVGDFGLATEVQKRLDNDTFVPSDNGDSTMAAFCAFNGGTFYYLPPEAFTTKKMTKRSDVFAYAIILHNVFVTQDDDRIYDTRDVLGDGDPGRYQLIFIDKLVNHALRPALPSRFTVGGGGGCGSGKGGGIGGGVALTRRLEDALCTLMQRGWQHDPAQRPSFESVAEELNALRETLDEARGATPPPFSPLLASASGDGGGKGDARRALLGDGDGDGDEAATADAAVAGGVDGGVLGDTLRVDALRLTSTTFYLDGPVASATSPAAGPVAAVAGDAFVCGLCRRGGFSARQGLLCRGASSALVVSRRRGSNSSSAASTATASSSGGSSVSGGAVDGAASSSSQGPRHFVCERCLCAQLTRQTDALVALVAAVGSGANGDGGSSGAGGDGATRDALRFERHDEALCCPLCLSGAGGAGGGGGTRRVSFYPLPQLASLLHATPTATAAGGDSGGGGGDGDDGAVTMATALSGYYAPLRALLAHCSRCDTTTCLDVTCRDISGGGVAAVTTPLDRVAVAYDTLRAAVAVPFREFLAAASRFSFDADADVDVDAFYAAVVTRYLPTLQLCRGDTEGDGVALFDAVLHVVTPPQRRAALQLRFWRDRPRVTLPCGHRLCTRCRATLPPVSRVSRDDDDTDGGDSDEAAAEAAEAAHALCCDGGEPLRFDLFDATPATTAAEATAAVSSLLAPQPSRCAHCAAALFAQYRHQRAAALHLPRPRRRRDTGDRDTARDPRDTVGELYPPATRIATPRDEQRYLVAVLRGVDTLRCGVCRRSQPLGRATFAPRHTLLQRLTGHVARHWAALHATPSTPATLTPTLTPQRWRRATLRLVATLCATGRVPVALLTPPPSAPPSVGDAGDGDGDDADEGDEAAAPLTRDELRVAAVAFRALFPVDVARAMATTLRSQLVRLDGGWQRVAFAATVASLATGGSGGSGGGGSVAVRNAMDAAALAAVLAPPLRRHFLGAFAAATAGDTRDTRDAVATVGDADATALATVAPPSDVVAGVVDAATLLALQPTTQRDVQRFRRSPLTSSSMALAAELFASLFRRFDERLAAARHLCRVPHGDTAAVASTHGGDTAAASAVSAFQLCRDAADAARLVAGARAWLTRHATVARDTLRRRRVTTQLRDALRLLGDAPMRRVDAVFAAARDKAAAAAATQATLEAAAAQAATRGGTTATQLTRVSSQWSAVTQPATALAAVAGHTLCVPATRFDRDASLRFNAAAVAVALLFDASQRRVETLPTAPRSATAFARLVAPVSVVSLELQRLPLGAGPGGGVGFGDASGGGGVFCAGVVRHDASLSMAKHFGFAGAGLAKDSCGVYERYTASAGAANGAFGGAAFTVEPSAFGANGLRQAIGCRRLAIGDVVRIVVHLPQRWIRVAVVAGSRVVMQRRFALPIGGGVGANATGGGASVGVDDFLVAVTLPPRCAVRVVPQPVALPDDDAAAANGDANATGGDAAIAATDAPAMRIVGRCALSDATGGVVVTAATVALRRNLLRQLRRVYLRARDASDAATDGASASDAAAAEAAATSDIVATLAAAGVDASRWERRFARSQRQAAAAFERFQSLVEWKLRVPRVALDGATDDAAAAAATGIDGRRSGGSGDAALDEALALSNEDFGDDDAHRDGGHSDGDGDDDVDSDVDWSRFIVTDDADRPAETELQRVTYADLAAAVVWFSQHRTMLEHHQLQILAQTYATLNGLDVDRAAEAAALQLASFYERFPSGGGGGRPQLASWWAASHRRRLLPSEDQMAIAFVLRHADVMQRWYAVDAQRRDRVVDRVTPQCRCLPRHRLPAFAVCPALTTNANANVMRPPPLPLSPHAPPPMMMTPSPLPSPHAA